MYFSVRLIENSRMILKERDGGVTKKTIMIFPKTDRHYHDRQGSLLSGFVLKER